MKMQQFYGKSYHSLENELINHFKDNFEDLTQLVFANAYSVVLSENDREFDFVLRKSQVIPDGFSIIAASKLLKISIKEKISGPDFINDFLGTCEKIGMRCFFLGGDSEKMSELLVKVIKDKYPNLEISGSYSPPFGIWSSEENDKIIKNINESKTDVLWVGLGSPKQDKWIYHNRKRLRVKIAAGVGAAFNFVTGKVKRAPVWMQSIGVEWLFRLLQEPRRLWKRYIYGNSMFCYRLIKGFFSIK